MASGWSWRNVLEISAGIVIAGLVIGLLVGGRRR